MKRISIVALLFLTVFASCKKDDAVEQPINISDSTNHSGNTQTLAFKFSHTSGNSALILNTTLADTTGRIFSLSDFRYYISNIVLIKDDGSELPLTGKVLLVDVQQPDYTLGQVPIGHYKGFRFMVGIDSAVNHSDPALYPSSSPLSYQPNTMHWGWNVGYILMKAEGLADTSFIPSGTLNGTLSYHLGTDELARVIDFSQHSFTVSESGTAVINLKFDFQKMLSGVDLQSENVTHTLPRTGLENKLADNWLTSFSVQ